MAKFDNAAKELLNYGRRTIVGGIRQRLAVRKISDTKQLSNSTSFSVTSSPTGLRGIGEAFDYWRTGGGSGSPPGTKIGKSKFAALVKWVERHEQYFSGGVPAWAIARGIVRNTEKLGSYRFRKGETNAYTDVISEQENNLNAIAEAFLKDAKTEIYPLLDRINKR